MIFTIVKWDNDFHKWEQAGGEYDNLSKAMEMADLFERITGDKHRAAEIYG